MKIIAILSALFLTLAIGITFAQGSGHGPAEASAGQKVAYGADTVCKLGCWG